VEISLTDLLHVGGASLIVIIIVQVIKTAWSALDTVRWGPLVSMLIGLVVVIGANVFAIADVRLDWGTAILTGILAGATASGLYDAGRGLTVGLGNGEG
jgi:hypothetical protein